MILGRVGGQLPLDAVYGAMPHCVRSSDGKAAVKIVPPCPRIPYWKGLGADSEEKRGPVSDIDIGVVDSLKVLDPNRPNREEDYARTSSNWRS